MVLSVGIDKLPDAALATDRMALFKAVELRCACIFLLSMTEFYQVKYNKIEATVQLYCI
jgi:hypothetical protein